MNLRFGVLFGSVCVAQFCQAVDVFNNDHDIFKQNLTGKAVVNAKYRLSDAYFDQSIDPGTDTVSGSYLAHNWANNRYLSNREMRFTLEHYDSHAFAFSLYDPASATTQAVSWGYLNPPPPGVNMISMNGKTPGAAFNSIRLQAVATRTLNGGSMMSFTNLIFESATLGNRNLLSGTVTPTSHGSGDQNGYFTQWIFPGVTSNLANHNWKITGSLMGWRDSVNSENDSTRFQITGYQLAAVPEPTSLAVVGIGLLVALRKRKQSS